jgi:hypothetical protein
VAKRLRTAVGFCGVPHVEQQTTFAVGQLDDLTLVHLWAHRIADLPSQAAVVAVYHVRADFAGDKDILLL